MSEKQHPIVALKQPQRPQRSRSPRNNLLLSLKKNDLELDFYSSIDHDRWINSWKRSYHD